MIGYKRIVALCTSRVFEPQVHSYIEILNETLRKHDCSLWIYAINADLYWNDVADTSETAVFDLIRWEWTDAVILMDEKIKSRNVSLKIIDNARKNGVPVIVVDGSYEHTVTIAFDYAKGFENVVRHVIEEHNVKRPHFMAGIKGNQFSDERLEVFKKVIAGHGIAFDDSMVSYGEFWSKPAREATEKLIAKGDIPEAVICANDIMAINVCDVLKNAGIRVPEDVIVTGFDGYYEAYLNKPALTTVSCTTPEFAGITAETVLKCIDGEMSGKSAAGGTESPDGTEDRIMVLPGLIRNESCGCPVCTDKGSEVLKSFNTVFYRYQDDIRYQHSIAAAMQASKDVKELLDALRHYYMPHAECFVFRDCLEPEGDFFIKEKPEGGYCLLFDWDRWSGRVMPYDLSQVSDGMIEQLSNGYPIVFNSFDYMNRNLGFICYSFPNYDLTDYSKTTGISNMISVGLGGYINMRYQQFLLEKVERMYQLDALTGLYNRLAFLEAYEKLRMVPENNGKRLTVIMADLDRLKKINDTLGHEAGDKAIAAVAASLKQACPESALCVRLGGDEMVAFILEECDYDAIIEKVGEYCEEKSCEHGFRISASCGAYATTFTPDTKLEEVIRHADTQMYMVKRGN
ncbi:MAG: GGDEF domain-containing protein [Lachnospiraceae bacterium]|nr:GGDEF domain-containing protein [Lachnospiraceae bacterium]